MCIQNTDIAYAPTAEATQVHSRMQPAVNEATRQARTVLAAPARRRAVR